MVKLGIIGCGGWGKNWVREAQNQKVLMAVCDPRLQDLRLNLPSEVNQFNELDTFLFEADVEAVVIATPAETHKDVALKCIAANKHVFIEKPLAVSYEDSKMIVDAIEQKSLVGMVGHLMLYHPAIAWIKNYINQGELGDLYYVTARRLNLGVVRQKENAIWSLAPHDLSIALHLFDEAPSRVRAMGDCFLQKSLDVADVGFIHMNFPSGKMFHGHFSWLDPVKKREIVLVGSKKMIVFEDSSLQEKVRVYDKGAITLEEGHPVISCNTPQIFNGDIYIPSISNEPSLTRELKAFCHAVKGDVTANLSPLSQGCEVAAILEKSIV